jgi:hypothetical protein
MDRADGGVPVEPEDNSDFEAVPAGPGPHDAGERFISSDEYADYAPYAEFEPYTEQDDSEPLRQQLAQFAFVREEDDREVRLSFRDVPADEIARAFRDSGALLISMTGERALSPSVAAAATGRGGGETALAIAPEEAQLSRSRRRRNRRARAAQAEDEGTQVPFRPNRHTGELTMRYFFALRDTVYTVNIASPTGIVESIASIYPSAAPSERDLRSRLQVVFRNR